MLFPVRIYDHLTLRTLANRRKVEAQVEFAVNCATKNLSDNFLGPQHEWIVSDSFLKGLSLMSGNLAEDINPHIPVMVYFDEYYWYCRSCGEDGVYRWTSVPYDDYKSLSDASLDKLINKVDTVVNEKLKASHSSTDFSLDKDFLMALVDNNGINFNMIFVFEDYPVTIGGETYSGTIEKYSALKEKL